VDDIPAVDLKAIIDKTYTAEVYSFTRAGQNAEDITPTLKLEDNLYLLSLSMVEHSPLRTWRAVCSATCLNTCWLKR